MHDICKDLDNIKIIILIEDVVRVFYKNEMRSEAILIKTVLPIH